MHGVLKTTLKCPRFISLSAALGRLLSYYTATLPAEVHLFSIFSCDKLSGFYCSHLHLLFVAEEILRTTAGAVCVCASADRCSTSTDTGKKCVCTEKIDLRCTNLA